MKQFHGRKSKVMIPIPVSVKNAAKRAFELKKLGFKGGTATGWSRARQLRDRESISIEDARFMRNWFARHIHASYPAFKEWKHASRPTTDSSWYRQHGILSWMIWGGDPAFRWINSKSVINKINQYFDTAYRPLAI